MYNLPGVNVINNFFQKFFRRSKKKVRLFTSEKYHSNFQNASTFFTLEENFPKNIAVNFDLWVDNYDVYSNAMIINSYNIKRKIYFKNKMPNYYNCDSQSRVRLPLIHKRKHDVCKNILKSKLQQM